MSVKWQFSDYWAGAARSEQYNFTGGMQQFVVPDGITSVTLALRGGNGGGSSSGRASGGYVKRTVTVNPGDILYIYVGGNGSAPSGKVGGAGGWHGGGDGGTGLNSGGYGGGGATDVRLNSTQNSAIIALAAGGGGNDGDNGHVGGPGGASGYQGGSFTVGATEPTAVTGCGTGGTPTTYGLGGSGGTGTDIINGANGAALAGGDGAWNKKGYPAGGGGGAGWFGGGGGGSNLLGNGYVQLIAFSGGGGSNYVDGDTNAVNQDGFIISNGVTANVQPSVTVSWQGTPSSYTWEINPNEGGSPTVTKNVAVAQNTGPNRTAILQEGQSQLAVIDFSGVLLTQTEYETLEDWFNRRVLIELTDDLGRKFYGIFTKWTPKRTRRGTNFWYHTYDAEFQVSAYVTASGNRQYGRTS